MMTASDRHDWFMHSAAFKGQRFEAVAVVRDVHEVSLVHSSDGGIRCSVYGKGQWLSLTLSSDVASGMQGLRRLNI